MTLFDPFLIPESLPSSNDENPGLMRVLTPADEAGSSSLSALCSFSLGAAPRFGFCPPAAEKRGGRVSDGQADRSAQEGLATLEED